MDRELGYAFDAFLDRIDFPKLYPEVRASAMRAIWGLREVSRDEFQERVYGADLAHLSAEDREEFKLLYARLWDALLVHQTDGVRFSLDPQPHPNRLHDIQNRVYIRHLEIQALEPMLKEDGVPEEHRQDWMRLCERVRQETDILARVIRETVTPNDRLTLGDWMELLDAIDRGLETAFNRLGWLYMRIRQENADASHASAHTEDLSQVAAG